jgi:hypothetical protein
MAQLVALGIIVLVLFWMIVIIGSLVPRRFE